VIREDIQKLVKREQNMFWGEYLPLTVHHCYKTVFKICKDKAPYLSILTSHCLDRRSHSSVGKQGT
tara:strand:+ start:405 stop:602 length:198 start_codon:yes stop_codon:yes gene_type:complete